MRTEGSLSTAASPIAELADEHGMALLAYVQRLVGGDCATAEDIVQETLIKAWQHPEAFLPSRGSARGWLFTVARNLAMDCHRRRSRFPEVFGFGHEGTPQHDWIDTVLDRHLIDAALGELTREHREVITEVYLEGVTVEDAAQRLGVPAGTVKSRAHYGLRNLKRALAGLGSPQAA